MYLCARAWGGGGGGDKQGRELKRVLGSCMLGPVGGKGVQRGVELWQGLFSAELESICFQWKTGLINCPGSHS